MSAVSGTRRAIRELSDGTIRVQVDIDPIHRREFLKLFPDIDTPVALAPLRDDFERPKEKRPQRLSEYAALLCKNPDFQAFVDADDEAAAATFVREFCKVKSRSELDTNDVAAVHFHELRQRFHDDQG